MNPAPCSAATPGSDCVFCRDELSRGIVERIEGSNAIVRSETGTPEEVAIDFLPGVRVGDTLLIRLGVALARAEAHA